MTERKIINLYEYFKNTPKKLKIVCDWDEVIQACEPYALYDVLWGRGDKEDFPQFFKEFWWLMKDKMVYSSYGSRINTDSSTLERQQEFKNTPNFYQEAPFLTIAEDLLKLIKEDKVEKLIFLVYSKVLGVKGETVIRDERIELVFKETFGKFPNCSSRKINYIMDDGGGVEIQWSKENWIKKFASDFDIVIDDNPNICKELFENKCMNCSDNCPDEGDGYKWFRGKVIAPYYPATENQHDKRVLLVKNEVSDLKKEDFTNQKKWI